MTLSSEALLKVTAFVTRTGRDGEREVVLIDHPHGGIQFPAGTMEEGEEPAIAARREAWEETGLSAFGEAQSVGEYEVEMPPPQAAILRTTPVYMRPRGDAESVARLRNGLGISIARAQAGFVQLTYAEHEDVERNILSAQITGWAPQEAITRHVRRFFFVLPFAGQAPASWMHTADHHHWRLFWAPVAALPPIVAGQAGLGGLFAEGARRMTTIAPPNHPPFTGEVSPQATEGGATSSDPSRVGSPLSRALRDSSPASGGALVSRK